MIRVLVNLLLGLRKVFQRLFAKIFEKFRDEETGKIKGINPNTLKNVVMIAAGVFFLGIILIQMFSSKTNLPGGLDEFRKEMSPKLGIGEREQNYKSTFGDDPLGRLDRLKGDPLSGLGALGTGGGTTGATGGAGTRGSGADGEFGTNSLGIALDENGNPMPNMSDCLDLIDKLKNGQILTGDEKATVDVCIEKNIAQLSAEELAAITQLARSDLSPEEREALRNYLAGRTDPDSMEGKAVKAMIDAIKAKDAQALQDARNMLAALAAKNPELAEALLKKIEHEPLSAREAALIKAFEDKIAALAREQGASGQTGADPFDLASMGGNREQLITNLSKDIAQREAEMKSLADQIAQAQAAAAKAGEKLAKGLPLTKAEQDAIKRLADLQARQAELAKLQKERMAMFARHMNALNKTLTQAALTFKAHVPSGISVEIDQTLNDCNNVKALPIKTVKTKPKPKADNKEVWLTTNGEPLTPDRIKMLQLLRNKKAQQNQVIADIKNPLGSTLGEKLNINEVLGEEGANIDIAALTVFADKSLKTFNLTPDMKIPAVLDSEILISDKGSNQMVRVRIIDDIHNPETGVIVIPKGSIAIAQTSGFNADTGIMDLTFDKVTVGSGKTLPVKLAIGSGDGTMGLKGQVRGTRGQFLLGAFVTSFAAGALNWFSQQIIQDYITATDAGNGLLGASMQGGSDVMNRIAEMYAGDLQNAAKIFYVPRNIPIVLFPQ